VVVPVPSTTEENVPVPVTTEVIVPVPVTTEVVVSAEPETAELESSTLLPEPAAGNVVPGVWPGMAPEEDEPSNEPSIKVTPGGIMIVSGNSVSTIFSEGWDGDNVCVDRQTEIVDLVDIRTGAESVGSSGIQHSCTGEEQSFTCVISAEVNDKKKTETITYECCEGFTRTNGECVNKQ
jgi:hypothetical protein